MDLRGIGGRLRRKVDLLPDDLFQINDRIRRAFHKVAFSDITEDEDIRHLAEEGYHAFLRVFDPKARDEFRRLLTYSRNTTIEITTDDFFLPWELLYIDSIERPISSENFLGAKYVISRIIDAGDVPFISPYISQVTPRIGLLTNNDLEYVSLREVPFFDRLQEEQKIFLFKLGILNPNDKQNGMRNFEVFLDGPLDIAHFACHAFGNNEHDLSNLVLSEQFEIALSDLEKLEQLQLRDNPIVVLNACGTGNINSRHASFFAKAFLKFGARGVIATDCEVPDSFAAEFAEHFYSEFLDGTPLGESLLKIRRYFLQELNKPAVLIYSMYATPMIRIANRQISRWQGE